MRISTIRSGGQTGADRGGLDAALAAGIPCGGWCPNGRKAEDGRIPDHYPVQEHPSDAYRDRTEANVIDADATVIFTGGALTGGSLETVECCRDHGKPCLHLQLDTINRGQAVADVLTWLGDEAAVPDPCVVNVAGSRESQAAGIGAAVREIMARVLRQTSGTLPAS